MLSVIKLRLLFFPAALVKSRVQSRSQGRVRPSGVASRQIVWSVEAAARVVPGAKSCLPQALAAQSLLLRHGFPSELKIGVARDGAGIFKAHAWVEIGGEVLIGKAETPDYQVLSAAGAGG